MTGFGPSAEVASPPVSGAESVLLLVADGRFPSGGHAHSNGYEAAARHYGLSSTPAVEGYVRNRLVSCGLSDAAMTAAIVASLAHRPGGESTVDAAGFDWAMIDAEVDARLTSPALRSRSRTLGRQWLRAGHRIIGTEVLPPVERFGPAGPHELPAFAAVGHALGLGPGQAALVCLHHLVAGITTAAVRLHGLDPFEIQAIHLRVAPLVDKLAAAAVAASHQPFRELPGTSGPMYEILADDHAQWDARLFQS